MTAALTFRNDATFKRVNGLANASWTSYASFSNPNLYLRHYNNVLKLEAVVTALDKSDDLQRGCTIIGVYFLS
ncbi:AbfB domain-containing protein [Paenibacillus amylolyticus]|nr:AbfB domain-containing protein [Paenibacillus amylolyticus]